MINHLKKSYFDVYKINLGSELPPIQPPTVKNSFLVLVSKFYFFINYLLMSFIHKTVSLINLFDKKDLDSVRYKTRKLCGY